MDRHEEIQFLLSKYRQGACSPDELERLFQWLDEQASGGRGLDFTGEEERELTRLRMRRAILKGTGLDLSGTIQRADEQTGLSDTALPLASEWPSGSGTSVSADSHARGVPAGMDAIRRRIIRLTAAAVLTIAVAGIWWLKAGRGPSVIVLSSAIGKVEKVNLPDQSTVWLNGNTELVLHDDFASRRTLEIRKGEAFFEVREDKQHPFTVRSNDVNTVVLGTSFSVKMVPHDSSAGIGMNAGEGGEVKVSVKTGKVMVSHHNDTLGFVRPMQRLRYHAASGGAVIDTVLNGEADSWTHGELFLQNASLDEVMQWLAGHFPVTIRNERHTYAGTYYLQARSDINLPQVLKILNLLGTKNQVRFTQKDQTIIIQ